MILWGNPPYLRIWRAPSFETDTRAPVEHFFERVHKIKQPHSHPSRLTTTVKPIIHRTLFSTLTPLAIMSPQSILSCKSNRLPPRKARPVFRSDSNHSSAKKNKKSSAILPSGTRQGNNKKDMSTHFVLDEEEKENPFYISLSPEAKIPYSTSPSKVSSLSTKVNPFAMNGAWHKYEGLAFLEGLEKCGTGKWKKICRYVPTRYVHFLNLVH